jgi:IclR family KDG regulon transcriptional repressor
MNSCPDANRPVFKPATTVTKVCRVIEEMKDHKWISINELARETSLLPSDIHRILTSLRASDFVDQDPETRQYRLGVALLRVGLTAFQRNQFREKAHPVLMRLSQQTGATVHLGVLDEKELEVIVIDQVEASAENIFHAQLGGTVQLHCTAIGKVILASLDPQTVAQALERSTLIRNTKRTITDFGALEKQLEYVHRHCYAVDRDECIEGASCLASPVFDDAGVVGAIGISMPTHVFLTCDVSSVSARLKVAASAVSAAVSQTGRVGHGALVSRTLGFR